MQRNSLIKIAAIAAIFAIGAEGAYAQKSLKIGTVARPGIPLGDALKDGLKAWTEKASGGKLLIEPHYAGSICGEQKCGEQANQGLLQMWTSSTANFGNFSTALSIFNLPYIFKNLDTANTISAGWLGEATMAEAEKSSQHHVLAVFASGGFRQLGNTQRPVHAPADLKGIKIRVTKSPIEFMLFKNWGGIPVPFDWLQTYQAMQTGVVDGLYVQVPWQYLFKMHEAAVYYTEMGGLWGGNHISMDQKQYNKLSADEKAWLAQGIVEFEKVVRSGDKEWVEAGVAKIKGEIKEWYVPNEAEMKLWRAGAVQAWKDSRDTYDGKLAERALNEQGLQSFVATLKSAGAL
jgi:TRAP-type C4-dicarboxylate transport system substrate-binding protein